jgi:hypothetical protein
MEEIREFDAVKRYSELRKTMNMSDAIIQLQVDILDADYKKHQHQLTEETNDELGKEIAKLRDVIWDKVGKEHQSGMIASPEYVVLLAKDLLSKLTEETEINRLINDRIKYCEHCKEIAEDINDIKFAEGGIEALADLQLRFKQGEHLIKREK